MEGTPLRGALCFFSSVHHGFEDKKDSKSNFASVVCPVSLVFYQLLAVN